MRRTLLLLSTMTLTVLAVGGIALALEFTCGANPCVGTSQNDTIHGTAASNEINARAGDDFAEGKANFDVIDGRGGADDLYGDIFGQNAAVTELCSDTLNGGGGADHLVGQCGSNFYDGGGGPDRIDAAFNDPNNAGEQVSAGLGNDRIRADDGIQDTIRCGAGTDTVVNHDSHDSFPDNDCETIN